VTRNSDWNSEIQIYKSALNVCPHSVKALANFASLCLGDGNYDTAISSTELAVSLYSDLESGWINGGIAYQRKGKIVRSLYWLTQAIRVSMPAQNPKAVGYLGSALYDFGSNIDRDSPSRRQVYIEAANTLDEAISAGFDPPSILHSRGSLAFDLNDLDSAVYYFSAALKKSEEEKILAIDVPKQDGIHEPLTLNQLGNALAKLGRTQDAINVYERGLQFSPPVLALHSNLGNLYRFVGNVDKARAVFEHGLDVAKTNFELESGSDVSTLVAALLNNLGLLEFETGRPGTALTHFRRAMAIVLKSTTQREHFPAGGANHAMNNKAKMVTYGDQSVIDVFKMNIEKAERALQNDPSQRENDEL